VRRSAITTSVGLQDILDLEQIEVHIFRGRVRPTMSTRTFGGEVAGQALIAAGRTVPGDRRVHSLHSYFLRPGDPTAPILYQVDPIRDGRSFTTRRTVGVQHGQAIFVLSASFQVPEEGFSHQIPQLDAPAPEALPEPEAMIADHDAASRQWYTELLARFPVEMRFPDEPPRLAEVIGEKRPPRLRVWLRSAERLPDDPLLHVCAATYVSDLFLLASALPPHRVVIESPGLQVASLDHAVWFHAAFRADEWLFYDTEGLWAGGGRGLCRGFFFDRSGALVATAMQEGLIRRRTTTGDGRRP
jgi:acyl-CoA thioesterase-2